MSDMPDLSSLIGMLNDKGIDFNNLANNLHNSSSESNENDEKSPSDNFEMPDMETMMKIMKLMKSLNSKDLNPSANLLYSLKPFLRDSKKEKVDEYVKFLKLSSIISEINKSGGDLK